MVIIVHHLELKEKKQKKNKKQETEQLLDAGDRKAKKVKKKSEAGDKLEASKCWSAKRLTTTREGGKGDIPELEKRGRKKVEETGRSEVKCRC